MVNFQSTNTIERKKKVYQCDIKCSSNRTIIFAQFKIIKISSIINSKYIKRWHQKKT